MVTTHRLGFAKAYYLSTASPPHREQTLYPLVRGSHQGVRLTARCHAQALCPAQYLGHRTGLPTAGLCKQKQKQMRSG